MNYVMLSSIYGSMNMITNAIATNLWRQQSLWSSCT